MVLYLFDTVKVNRALLLASISLNSNKLACLLDRNKRKEMMPNMEHFNECELLHDMQSVFLSQSNLCTIKSCNLTEQADVIHKLFALS